VLCPGFNACQLQQLVKVKLGEPPPRVTFQLLVTVTGSLNPSVTVQPEMAAVPLLVTVTSTW
jgi:hypothetical protein